MEIVVLYKVPGKFMQWKRKNVSEFNTFPDLLPYCLSDNYGLEGILVSLTCYSLNGGSLKIMHTVPLIQKFIEQNNRSQNRHFLKFTFFQVIFLLCLITSTAAQVSRIETGNTPFRVNMTALPSILCQECRTILEGPSKGEYKLQVDQVFKLQIICCSFQEKFCKKGKNLAFQPSPM